VTSVDLVPVASDVEASPTPSLRSGRLVGVPVGVLVVCAVVATWIATRHGPQLSPDSVTYLSLAHNLLGGRGFVDLTGQANTTFAPGFPGLLAFGQSLGFTAATTARVVNEAAFAAIVLLTWILVSRHTTSRIVAVGATATVVVSPTLLDVSSHTWSEPVFCVVVLCFILVLEEALARGDTSGQRGFLAGAGVLAGVGFMMRYAGVTLIPVGMVVAYLGAGRRPVRLGRVGVFLAAALPLPLIWLARNATSGAPYLLGPRMSVQDSVGSLLSTYGQSFISMFTYDALLHNYLVALAPLTALAVFGLIVTLRQREHANARSTAVSIVPLLAFILCYSASVVVSAKTAGSSIDTRIVMPVFVPVVVVGAWLASLAFAAARSTTNAWFRGAITVLALGVAVSLIVNTVNFIQTSWTTGQAAHGYATATVARSPLARAVTLRAGPSAVVATNSPWTLYSATGHQPIVPAPAPLYPSASLVPTSSDTLADIACHRTVYFAWYAHSRRPSTNLGAGLRLTSVVRVSDGVLYTVHPPRSECGEHDGS
jgi:4-amino-4-deoxy-L-arabinose transferase-like glycosyltransferase